MKAVILAGGKGLRLRKIIKNIPKPMVSIAGKPFLEYLILFLLRKEINEIVLSVCHQAEKIKKYFGDGKKWNAKIIYSQEEEPLGTGGALKKASSLFSDQMFLAMNGDSFLNINISRFIEYHKKKGAKITIAVVSDRGSDRYGVINVNQKGAITSFFEKEAGGNKFINAGIYIVSKKIFNSFDNNKISLEKDIFPYFVNKGLYAMKNKGFFVDIGVPSDYLCLYNNPARILEATVVNKRPYF